jgi:hypothetical protein
MTDFAIADQDATNEHQKLGLRDHRAVRRWFWSNAVFGAICLAVVIVVVAKFSGSQPDHPATAQNMPKAVHAEAK